MTAPYLNPAELKQRGFTIEGETPPPTVAQSMQNLVAKPTKRKTGYALEDPLQKNVEGWLRLQGYRPRTPYEIMRGGDCAGWYVHLNETLGNPIILDLLILSVEGWYVEIELKSETGKTSEEQEAIIQRGGVLCRTLDEVKLAMEEKRINWRN